MVDELRAFASEVTRVAREVGTEGRLGGQAQVEGVSGVWEDLTNNVNTLAGNLTSQVPEHRRESRPPSRKAISARKITVDVKGEVAELEGHDQHHGRRTLVVRRPGRRASREVGTEGQLGGQAQVEGVSGGAGDLTENVNTLAGNLTSQVRNIAEVTTAVALGDLSRKITVDVKARS